MANRDLAFPFRIQQVLPAFRRAGRRDILIVVSNEIQANIQNLKQMIRVRVPHMGDQPVRRLRSIGPQGFFPFQHVVMTVIGGAEDVALRDPGLHILRQPLIGDLRCAADHIDLDARLALREGLARGLPGFRWIWQEYQVSSASLRAASYDACSWAGMFWAWAGAWAVGMAPKVVVAVRS